MKSKRNVRLTVATVCLSFAAALIAAPAATHAQGRGRVRGNFDTRYLSSQAFFVFAARVGPYLNEIAKESEFVKKMFDQATTESGMDPRQMELVVFQMTYDPNLATEREYEKRQPSMSYIMRMGKDIGDVTSIRQFRDNVKTEYKGRTYYQATRKYRDSVFLPDNRTMVVAKDYLLRQIMDGPVGMNSIISDLKRADADLDIVGYFNMEPIGQFMKAQMTRGGAPPPPFDQFLVLPDNLRYARLTGKLDSDTPLTLTAWGHSEEAAKKLEKAANVFYTFTKAQYEMFRDEIKKEFPDKELAERMVAAIDKFFKGVTIRREGKRVIVEVKAKGGLKDAPLALSMMLFGVRVGGGAAPPAKAAPRAVDDKPARAPAPAPRRKPKDVEKPAPRKAPARAVSP